MRWTPLALSLLLVGCDLADTKDPLDTGTVVDEDGDGYAADVDCDDADATINPDAAEICDGVDNDCDALTDDDDDSADLSTGSVFFADGDSDGVGDDVISVEACSLPSGYAEVGGDCDDADASVYPAAAEICDGQYNDCDSADYAADGSPLSEIDGDTDGYVSCDYDAAAWVGDSAVVGGGDCDDADATLSPNVTEICDSIDNDCDALIDDDDDSLDASTGSTFYADNDGDTYGDAKNTVGACLQPKGYVTDSTDCDDADTGINPGEPEIPQDGVDDNCDGYDGCVDLDCDGYTDVYITSLNDYTSEILVGDGTTVSLDTTLTSCTTYEADHGDLNGDGYIDIVHAPYSCSSGYSVFYGSSTGYSDKNADIVSAVFAYGVEVEDLNGDGYDDVVYSSDSSGGSIYWGSASGLTTSPTSLPANNGWDVSTGDANGDGYTDVAFCSSGTSSSYLYYGSSSGFSSKDYDLISSNYAYSCTMEDLDRDGYEELILGGYSTYDAYIYWGSTSGYATTSRTSLPSGSSSYSYGISIGDYDADGYQDITFSAWGSASSSVFYGSTSGYLSTDTTTLAISYNYQATTADLNGDGYDDLLAPAYIDALGQVFLGSASGLSSTPDYEVSTDSIYTVSTTDLDGDGYWDLLLPSFSNSSSGLDIFWGSASGWSDTDTSTVKSGVDYTFAAPLIIGSDDSARSK